MHRRVITEHFDPPKTSGFGQWSSIFKFLRKFWRRILYIAFNRDTFVFLNENLGRLTLIIETQHLNYLLVGSISLHNLGTFVNFVEPYLINFDVSPTRKNISMFVNILRSHLTHKGQARSQGTFDVEAL